MSHPFPSEDLLPPIFVLLPTKEVMKFKSLDRLSKSILSGRPFTKAYLKNSKNPIELLVDFNHDLVMPHAVEARQTLAQSIFLSLRFPNLMFNTLSLPQNAMVPGIGLNIIASCNGLLLMEICPNHIAPIRYSKFYSVWNPYTRESREIFPMFNSLYGYGNSYSMTMGYDDISDDYKLLQFSVAGGINHCFVMSLKSSDWKEMRFVNDGIEGHSIQCHGNLHWVAEAKLKIVAFKLQEESFTEFPIPSSFSNGVNSLQISSSGSLLVLARRQLDDSGILRAWVLKDYAAIPQVWTLIRVNVSNFEGSFFLPPYQMEFRVWMRHYQSNQYTLYDLNNMPRSRIQIELQARSFLPNSIFILHQTLESPNPNGHAWPKCASLQPLPND